MSQDLQQIEQRLAAEIETLLARESGAVKPESALASLGLDSLRFVSLLIVVEKTFGVNLMKGGIQRESLKSVRTLAAAINEMRRP